MNTDIMMQTCKACNLRKPAEDFLIRRWTTPKGRLKEGLRKICKLCDAAKRRANYAAPDSVSKASRKRYDVLNANSVAAKRRAYYEANRLKWIDPDTGWRHSSKAKAYDAAYQARPETKLATALRGRNWRQANKPHLLVKTRKRQAHVARATPSWASEAAIRAIYEEAARRTFETGIKHEVDHYYPLQGKLICGLHVEANLRIITATANRKKHNHMPE